MADPFTRLIAISQQTERLLETRFGATGRGLHEKLSSVAEKIPERVQKKIRFVATIRNKATHEDVKIAKQELPAVRAAFQEILPFLDGGASRRKALIRNFLIGAAICLVVVIYIISR